MRAKNAQDTRGKPLRPITANRISQPTNQNATKLNASVRKDALYRVATNWLRMRHGRLLGNLNQRNREIIPALILSLKLLHYLVLEPLQVHLRRNGSFSIRGKSVSKFPDEWICVSGEAARGISRVMQTMFLQCRLDVKPHQARSQNTSGF